MIQFHNPISTHNISELAARVKSDNRLMVDDLIDAMTVTELMNAFDVTKAHAMRIKRTAVKRYLPAEVTINLQKFYEFVESFYEYSAIKQKVAN